jgi:hypothetical protein
MAEAICPNCGHHLVDLRVDRQPVGQGSVVLQWAKCERCGHVGLKRWHFSDGILPNPRVPDPVKPYR